MRPARTQVAVAPRHRHPVKVDQISDNEVAQLVRSMISLSGGTARIMEFCYWTSEPGMLEIVRALAVLPEITREKLRAFLDSSPPAAQVVAASDAEGLKFSFRRSA
jgi:hypothetical protein